ncbi:pectin acetylesterase, family CE13 [Zostera marina]|uniref:Pectin acetylesterase n=1 Tax=Zostera marina TaxID=29655 RepID=A0A0K9NX41_ZOSMR|nr:pectin acetylesterase, family CE13 [Zostera marina]
MGSRNGFGVWILFISLYGFSHLQLFYGAVNQQDQIPPKNYVKMTIVKDGARTGAVCLDGSLPGYHIQRGSESGSQNWLLQFEGGGWCHDVKSCSLRSTTYRGSTSLMNKYETFTGILSDDISLNPDFYSWNRVKIRYCDGASFGGDSEYSDHNTTLYFRGQKIWKAVLNQLISKEGLGLARMALLSGCSAGGLATFLHCDDFAKSLPNARIVKCLSDAGFFIDVNDINDKNSIRTYFQNVTYLQDVEKNLNMECKRSHKNPYECFFPQYGLETIKTPYFLLNSAYDVYQFHHIFVPPSSDPKGLWKDCSEDPGKCSKDQILVLQGYRIKMLEAMKPNAIHNQKQGFFVNSCFAHCQSEAQDVWSGHNSPRIHNKTIAQVVGSWYFEREMMVKQIDCPYPCDKTCHNLIPIS